MPTIAKPVQQVEALSFAIPKQFKTWFGMLMSIGIHFEYPVRIAGVSGPWIGTIGWATCPIGRGFATPKSASFDDAPVCKTSESRCSGCAVFVGVVLCCFGGSASYS